MTLPKLEDYKAPWEVDSSGAEVPEDEQKLEPARLKKFLHGLLSDKERLQTKVATVTADRDSIKTELEAATSKDATDVEKVAKEHQKALDAAKADGDLKALRLEVALGIEGITPAQARKLASRLTGKDQDELEADAKSLAEDFGIGKSAEDDGSDDGNEPKPQVGPGSKPRRVTSSLDPEPSASSGEIDINKVFPRR